MTAFVAREYQRNAVENALDIFRYAESQIQAKSDYTSQKEASYYNGCILLEAPTGSGKTCIAGMLAEEFSRTDKKKIQCKSCLVLVYPFCWTVTAD